MIKYINMIETFKKYKKTLLFIIFYIIAVILAMSLQKYYTNGYLDIGGFVKEFNILSSIVLGILYSQGFTAPIAASIFAFYPEGSSTLFIAFLGGLGAALIDLIMYEILKYEIHGEVQKIKNINFFKFIGKLPVIKSKIFMTLFGFFIIASPIADDLGIILVEEEGLIKAKYFFLINLIMNTIGIYFFLNI